MILLKKLYAKWKDYPTFKLYIGLALLAELAVMIFELDCQRNSLQDVQAVMQDDAMAFVGTIVAYAIKSGFEHSKWATPQQAMAQIINDHPVAVAAVSGLISSGGDLTSAASSAISAAQMAAEQQAQNEPQNNSPDQGENNNMAG